MGFAQPTQYTFEFWRDYVRATRDFLARARRIIPSLSMRQLDRALWQVLKGKAETWLARSLQRTAGGASDLE